MRGRYKSWTPGYIDEHPDVSPRKVDVEDPYYQGKLVLEIGSGKGAFLRETAKLHPDIRYVGLERDVTSCGSAAKKAVDEELTNVRFLNLDFDDCFEDLSKLRFTRIHVHFPDPWPKKRHEKRRLLYPERLKKILSLLDRDAVLEFRTDNADLFEYALSIFEVAGAEIVPEPYPEEEAMSEYETRFRNEGVKINRVLLTRKGN